MQYLSWHLSVSLSHENECGGVDGEAKYCESVLISEHEINLEVYIRYL